MKRFEIIFIVFLFVLSNMVSFSIGKVSSFVPVVIKTDTLYPMPQIQVLPDAENIDPFDDLYDEYSNDHYESPHDVPEQLPYGDQYDVPKNGFEASAPFTERQHTILKLAKEIGEDDNFSLTLMGIALQESLAGELDKVGHKSAPFGKRSYGVMQVKLQAAMDVFRKFPDLKEGMKTDEEIIGRLIYDDEFNIKVSLGYIKVLKSRGMSWRQILLSYNVGPTAAKKIDPNNYRYVTSVIGHINGEKIAFMEEKL